MASTGIRFGHVNLTGHDWRRLAGFYTEVFGCELVPPERDIRGAVLDAATGLQDAHLTGAHLRLPGHGDTGPTIEIFSYDALEAHPGPRVDRPGWGHVAFQVPDVPAAVEAVVEDSAVEADQADEAAEEPSEEPEARSDAAPDDVSVEADADTVAHGSTPEPEADASEQSDS